MPPAARQLEENTMCVFPVSSRRMASGCPSSVRQRGCPTDRSQPGQSAPGRLTRRADPPHAARRRGFRAAHGHGEAAPWERRRVGPFPERGVPPPSLRILRHAFARVWRQPSASTGQAVESINRRLDRLRRRHCGCRACELKHAVRPLRLARRMAPTIRSSRQSRRERVRDISTSLEQRQASVPPTQRLAPCMQQKAGDRIHRERPGVFDDDVRVM